ncbi:MAG TPA: sigma-70 family RNA polymerase sigma factor, partial [Actinomycetota bacterium]
MDERAGNFDDLCRAHRRRLVSMLRRRTGDPEAAEDLAQETLLRAFRYQDRVDPSKPIWPWLRAIALNRAATWAERQPCTASLEGVERFSDLDELGEVESRDAMRALIVDLTEAQQRALWLRYVHDQDSRRAAATLGLSVAAFKQLLHRARTRLRATLEAGGSILAPAVVPLRALRRILFRGGRSGSDTQRLAECLAPVGAAAVALFLVMGGATSPPADAGPAPGHPPAASGGQTPTDRVRDPGADAVRRAAGILR